MSNINFIQFNPDELMDLIEKRIEKTINSVLINAKNSNNNTSNFLTEKETASLLKVNRTTIYNWTKKGKLTKYSIGNRVLYKLDEIENALKKIN